MVVLADQTLRVPKPSIAVLPPFDNFGGDPKWERFEPMVLEDIIADLAQS